MDKNLKSELRAKLPGFERKEILASRGEGSDKKSLIYVWDIRGFCSDLLKTESLWVLKDTNTWTYDDINEAVDKFCSI